jgi:hypothetical protein
MTDELAEFILARVGEDEALSRAAGGQRRHAYVEGDEMP